MFSHDLIVWTIVVVFFVGLVFITGGQCFGADLSVECFDPVTDTPHSVKTVSMLHPRHSHCMTNFRGWCLIVIFYTLAADAQDIHTLSSCISCYFRATSQLRNSTVDCASELFKPLTLWRLAAFGDFQEKETPKCTWLCAGISQLQ